MKLQVLFAIFTNICCVNQDFTLEGRPLTLRHETENKTSGPSDSFKQIGLTLKGARRSQGLSVKDVSEKLRISVDYLTKLEAGLFDELPAPAYVTGYLRSYGRCVGLPPDPLVSRYLALTADNVPKPTYKTPMSTSPPQRSAPAVASVLVLCAGIVYGGWFWLKTESLPVIDGEKTGLTTVMLNSNQESVSIETTSPTSISTVDPASNNMASAAAKPNTSSLKGQTITPANSALNATRTQITKNPTQQIAGVEATALEPTALIATGDDPAARGPRIAQNMEILGDKKELNAADVQPTVLSKAEKSKITVLDELARMQILTPDNLTSADLLNSSKAIANLRDPEKEIIIRAVAASWVEIVRDDGEEVMAKLMRAGDSYVVEGNTRLYLSTGNAGGLMVVIGADAPILMGDVGEIVRDLPLAIDKLRKVL